MTSVESLAVDPRLVAVVQRMSRACSAGVVALGLLVLAGSAVDTAAMQATTGVLLVTLGVAEWSAHRDRARSLTRGCALLVIAGAVWSGALATDALALAPATAAAFALLGLAVLLIDVGRARHLVALAGALATAIALAAICGWLYGASAPAMPMPAALGLFAAGLAGLLARPRDGLAAPLAGDTTAGALLRRVLPVVAIVPVAAGWLWLRAQDEGLDDARFAVAVLTACAVVVPIVAIAVTAASLHARELERRTSDRRFRLAIEAAPTGMLMSDREGRIVLVNGQVEQLFGYARDELLGRPVEMLIPERFRTRHPGHRAGFLDDPRARVMGAGRDLHGLRKDGSEVPIEIGLNPVQSSDGEFVLSSIVEISERKRAMDLLRLAIEAAPTGMIMLDQDGVISLINAQVEKLFGYSREELVGCPVEMLVPQPFRARHPDLRAAFLREPSIRSMGAGRDLYGRRKDGSEVPVEIALNPLHTPSGDFVLSSVVDITERKQAEQALRDLNAALEERVRARTAELSTSLREREVLLQEVHHRVKNNLQVISSLISMQGRQLNDRAASTAIEECKSRVEAIALIHEKLYQSKDYARVQFAEYARGLAANVFHATGISPTHIALTVDIEAIALPVDRAIPCGLILNELLTNAFRHGFPGDRHGAVEVTLRTADGGLVLQVADDGIGMPPGFDPETSRSLGLRLVRILVGQLDGHLEVAGDGGTTFLIAFPMQARKSVPSIERRLAAEPT